MKNLQENRKHLWAHSRPPTSGEKNLSTRIILELMDVQEKNIKVDILEGESLEAARRTWGNQPATIKFHFQHFNGFIELSCTSCLCRPSRGWFKGSAHFGVRTYPDFLLLVAASTQKKLIKKLLNVKKKKFM